MDWFRFAVKSAVHGTMNLAGRSRRGRSALRGKLVVLTYHSFCDTWPRGLISSLPVARFERQIQYLREHFHIVPLADGVARALQGNVSDRPWLAITIDDGFRDNYTHAWPVLQKYHVPATIFLATDFIDTGRPPWPTQLVEILNHTKASAMARPIKLNLQNDKSRSAAVRALMSKWGALDPEVRFQRLSALASQLGVDRLNRSQPMRWSEIRQMNSEGITFGSHTVFHSLMPKVSAHVAVKELRDSRQRIEDELQSQCVSFAFPDGAYDERARNLLSACGYQCAVTQDNGINDARVDPLCIKRIDIPFHDPLTTFRARVSAAI